jgi:hypothetical protein
MRFITKALLILNVVFLAFVVLWLLVGGSGRGYYGGGAATEVDGILLMSLAAFNVLFLLATFLALPGSSLGKTAEELAAGEVRWRELLRGWAQWALVINGVVILFVGLWLLVSSGRWNYFRANATEVDMIVLFVLSLLNLCFMGLCFLRFSRSPNAGSSAGDVPGTRLSPS